MGGLIDPTKNTWVKNSRGSTPRPPEQSSIRNNFLVLGTWYKFLVTKNTRKACKRRAQRVIAAPPGESEYNSGSGWKAFFSYPCRIWRPRSLSSCWNFRVPFRVRKLESWGYSVVKVAWSYLEPSLTDPPVWQTDRRTDGRWHIAHYSIHAIARQKLVQESLTNAHEPFTSFWYQILRHVSPLPHRPDWK